VKYDGSALSIQEVVTATTTIVVLTTVTTTTANTTIASTTISQTESGQLSGLGPGLGPGLAFLVIMIGVGAILGVAGLAFAFGLARSTHYPV
jgi:hypothetical protein